MAPEPVAVDSYCKSMQRWFDTSCLIWDGETGDLLHAGDDLPQLDESLLGPLSRVVADQFQPQFVVDEEIIGVFGIPVRDGANRRLTLMMPFALRDVEHGDNLNRVADVLGCSAPQALNWVTARKKWRPATVQLLGESVFEQLCSEAKSVRLQKEIDSISNNLTSTYEEISLLYGVIENLRISRTDEELAALSLDWLQECLPAAGLALLLLPISESGTYDKRSSNLMLTAGNCPLDESSFVALMSDSKTGAGDTPYVANLNVTSQPGWRHDSVRQVILAPMSEGEHLFGYVAAFNHTDDDEFGTIEASLLRSVASILGIHAGNRDLYRAQADFLASVVRAMTSAIDAKDPYTCGHSDRVARVAVRLAQELDCDSNFVSMLYMAGLLHDVGKIGIDDNVLCKPGRLSDAEYEHIKMHPELGFKILADIRQLRDCLPVVLHHHEQWDGGGYPHGLAGEDIPLSARITAVADAYDAMSSDRPYRKGMPIAKVDSILRDGSGTQWDAAVIDAYFAAHDDILAISNSVRENLSLDVEQWN